VLDYNDTHISNHAHTSAPAVAAALSACDAQTTGAEFLQAVILGMEVHFAFAQAVMPSHFRRGFHITATGGTVGAAATAALLLRLDDAQIDHAIAAAVLTACGLREGLTTMSNAYGVGNAARGGFVAASLARHGLTSAMSAFDGPDGCRVGMSAVGPEVIEAAFAALGQHWAILHNSYKQFPTETITQAALEGILAVRAQTEDADPERVARIDIAAGPIVAEMVTRRAATITPDDVLTRTFDTRFCVAMAWLDGAFGPASLACPPARAEAAMALRARIVVTAEAAFKTPQARVSVMFADGTMRTHFVDGYVGCATRPMSDADLESKFRRAAAPTPAATRTEAIIGHVRTVETLSRVTALTEMLHD
jgi:2-methylcitrate dehydratase PrpD